MSKSNRLQPSVPLCEDTKSLALESGHVGFNIPFCHPQLEKWEQLPSFLCTSIWLI